VTARGRWAGTTDDQRFVIVFGVIVLMVMASATTRAVLPRSVEIEEILGIVAINRVYTKTRFVRRTRRDLRESALKQGRFARIDFE
jgi:hypothetical protein